MLGARAALTGGAILECAGARVVDGDATRGVVVEGGSAGVAGGETATAGGAIAEVDAVVGSARRGEPTLLVELEKTSQARPNASPMTQVKTTGTRLPECRRRCFAPRRDPSSDTVSAWRRWRGVPGGPVPHRQDLGSFLIPCLRRRSEHAFGIRSRRSEALANAITPRTSTATTTSSATTVAVSRPGVRAHNPRRAF